MKCISRSTHYAIRCHIVFLSRGFLPPAVSPPILCYNRSPGITELISIPRNGMGGIVLAGGKSARMGANKATLELGGRSLVDLAIQAVSRVTEPVIVVGGRDILPEAVNDLFPGEGPLGGLITGLESLGHGAHLAVACDMPFI